MVVLIVGLVFVDDEEKNGAVIFVLKGGCYNPIWEFVLYWWCCLTLEFGEKWSFGWRLLMFIFIMKNEALWIELEVVDKRIALLLVTCCIVCILMKKEKVWRENWWCDWGIDNWEEVLMMNMGLLWLRIVVFVPWCSVLLSWCSLLHACVGIWF